MDGRVCVRKRSFFPFPNRQFYYDYSLSQDPLSDPRSDPLRVSCPVLGMSGESGRRLSSLTGRRAPPGRKPFDPPEKVEVVPVPRARRDGVSGRPLDHVPSDIVGLGVDEAETRGTGHVEPRVHGEDGGRGDLTVRRRRGRVLV